MPGWIRCDKYGVIHSQTDVRFSSCSRGIQGNAIRALHKANTVKHQDFNPSLPTTLVMICSPSMHTASYCFYYWHLSAWAELEGQPFQLQMLLLIAAIRFLITVASLELVDTQLTSWNAPVCQPQTFPPAWQHVTEMNNCRPTIDSASSFLLGLECAVYDCGAAGIQNDSDWLPIRSTQLACTPPLYPTHLHR